mgnify:CR=1 FL=1
MERRALWVLGIVLLASIAVGAFIGARHSREIGELKEDLAGIREDISGLKNAISEFKERVEKLQAAEVTLYFGRMTATDFFLVPEKRTVNKVEGLPKAALEELIRGPRPGSGLEKLIPEGTKLRNFKVRDGIAYADFSGEIRSRFPGGSRREELLVYSIVNTLTQFPEIQKVQFLIEGEKADTIGGHMGINEPLAREESVIGPTP